MERSWNPLHESTGYASGKGVPRRSVGSNLSQQATDTVPRNMSIYSQNSGPPAKRSRPVASSSGTVQIRGRRAATTSLIEIPRPTAQAQPVFVPHDVASSVSNRLEPTLFASSLGGDGDSPPEQRTQSFSLTREHACPNGHDSDFQSLSRSLGPHVIPHTSVVVDHFSVPPHLSEHATHTHNLVCNGRASIQELPFCNTPLGSRHQHGHSSPHLPPAPPALRLVTHAHTDHLSGVRSKAATGPLMRGPSHGNMHTSNSMPVLATPITAALLAGQPVPMPTHTADAATPPLFTYACGGARVTRYHPALPGYGCCSWPSQDATAMAGTGCKWVTACVAAREGDAGACVSIGPTQALAPVDAAEDSDDDVVVLSHTLPPLRTPSVSAGNAAHMRSHLSFDPGTARALDSLQKRDHVLAPAPSLPLRDNPALRVSCLQPVPLDTLRALVAAAEAPRSGPCGMREDLDWDVFGGADAAQSCDNHHLTAEDRAHGGVSAADTRHTPMSLPHFPACPPLPACARHAIPVAPLHALLYLNCLPAPASEPCCSSSPPPPTRRSTHASDAPQLHEALMPHPALYGCSGDCEQPPLATSTTAPSCHSCHPHVLVAVLPANHCPGSALLVLRTRTRTVLHTGDLRYSATLHRLLLRVLGPVDAVHMDATFTHCHVLLPAPAQGLAQLRSRVRAFVRARVGALARLLLPADTGGGEGAVSVDDSLPRLVDNPVQGVVTCSPAAGESGASLLRRSLPQLHLLFAHLWALRALPTCPASGNPPAPATTNPLSCTDTNAPPDPVSTSTPSHNTPLPSSPTAAAGSPYTPSASLLGPLDCVVSVGALGHEPVLFALHAELQALRTAMHVSASRLLGEYARAHGGAGTTADTLPLPSAACLLLDHQQALLVHRPMAQNTADARARGPVSSDAAVHWSAPAALPRALQPVLQPLLLRSHTTAARRISTCLHTLTALNDADTGHTSDAGCVGLLGRHTSDSTTDPFVSLEGPPCPPRCAFALSHKPDCEAAVLASAISSPAPLAIKSLPGAHPPTAPLLASSSLFTTCSAVMRDTPNTSTPTSFSAPSASADMPPRSLASLLAQLSLPGALPLVHAPLFLALLLLLSPPRALLAPSQGLHALADRARSSLRHAVGTVMQGDGRVGALVLSALRAQARERECTCLNQYVGNHGRASLTEDSDDDCCVIVEDADEPVLLSARPEHGDGAQGLLQWWASSHARHFPSLFQHYWGALPPVSAPLLTATRPPYRCNCDYISMPATAPSETATNALFQVHFGGSRQPDHVFNRLLLLLLWLEAEAEAETDVELALARGPLRSSAGRPSQTVPPPLVLKPSAMFFAQRMVRLDYSVYTHQPTRAHTPYGVSLPRGARGRAPALHEYLEELRRATRAAEEVCSPREEVAVAVVEDELGVTHVCVTMHSDYRGALHLLADTQPHTVLAVCDGLPEADDLRDEENEWM